MASAINILYSLPPTSLRSPIRATKHSLSPLPLPYPRPRLYFPPYPRFQTPPKLTTAATFAYVSGPASDPIVTEPDPKPDPTPDPAPPPPPPPSVVSRGLLWRLLMKHKLRLALSALALVGCTTCTLSMPIFSGQKSLDLR